MIGEEQDSYNNNLQIFQVCKSDSYENKKKYSYVIILSPTTFWLQITNLLHGLS